MTVKIVLDANFLMLPHAKKLDVFSELARLFTGEHELLTLTSVVRELEGISRGSSAAAAAAGTALKLIAAKGVSVVESRGPTDEAIVDYAIRSGKTLVATNDRRLKRKLKSSGVKTVSLLGEDKLIVA